MLGIIESLDNKVDKLLSSDFNSGVKHLEELTVARKEQDFILKEAWKRFATALTHEKSERKAFAYIALAYCQYRLDEKECCFKTLSEFISCDFTDQKSKAADIAIIAGIVGVSGATGAGIGVAVTSLIIAAPITLPIILGASVWGLLKAFKSSPKNDLPVPEPEPEPMTLEEKISIFKEKASAFIKEEKSNK